MQMHIIPYLGEASLNDLATIMLEKFYTRLIEAGVGIRTVCTVHSILHHSLERAVFHLLLTCYPAAHATLPSYK